MEDPLLEAILEVLQNAEDPLFEENVEEGVEWQATIEWKFWEAAKDGNETLVKEILENNPTLDVNWKNERNSGETVLLQTCGNGHDAIVAVLLAHPNIDINQKANDGWTPFHDVCWKGHASCARLLLKDSRINVNERDNSGKTPLYVAASYGDLVIIKWWIASGREMDLGQPGDIYKTDAIGGATTPMMEELETEEDHQERVSRCEEVVALLERYQENPVETRYAVRVELGCVDELAAETLALVVFVSDGFLQINKGEEATTLGARFFTIASQLPLELQMVLCYRMVGSDKQIVKGWDTEVAFKNLAKRI